MYYGEIDKNHYDFLFDELEQMIQKRFNERKDKRSLNEQEQSNKNSSYPLNSKPFNSHSNNLVSYITT